MEKQVTTLTEGDIFYTMIDGNYHIFKLLKDDAAAETLHVMVYEPLSALPAPEAIDTLTVQTLHTPIYSGGFDNPVLLAHRTVTAADLEGYQTYLAMIEAEFEATIREATAFYEKGYQLTDANQPEAAIAAYTQAIQLLPTFYEAIDNRAFCKMDLGRWAEAIEDFQLSLQVQPDSILAEFSIGECYYRSGNYTKAKEQFARCLRLDPSHEISARFMQLSDELMHASRQ